MKTRLKQFMVTTGVAAVSVASAALPATSDVSIEQLGGKVKVRYSLNGAPAVVTVDIQTNSTEGGWVSIGAENFRSLTGDVNRRVTPGGHAFAWKSRQDGATFKIDGNGLRAVLKVHDVTQPPDWMTVDLSSGDVRYYDCEEALPGGFSSDAYKTTHVLLRKIPAAGMSFLMGHCDIETVASADQLAVETQHEVILTKDYYMAVYETTVAQYARVMADGDTTSKLPRNGRSWNALRGTDSEWPSADGHVCSPDSFFGVLQSRSGQLFDLPTEAQWEFACRAGTSGVFNNGRDCVGVGTGGSDPAVEEVAWCSTNSGDQLHEVGTRKPNAWQLYDMHGNVNEICLDAWVADLGSAPVVDPVGPTTGGESRARRGGSIKYYTNNLRSARRTSAERTSTSAENGFRICVEAVAR